MLFKAKVIQEVKGRTYEGSFNTLEERDEYVNRVLAKRVIGLPEREILKINLKPELVDRVISTTIKQSTVYNIDPDTGEEIEEVIDLEYVTVKSDFVVELSEVNNYAQLRQSEYPSIQEVLHVILDHGLESDQMTALQELRASIKAKYPKE